MKENDGEQDLTAENAAKKIAKERPRSRARKEARTLQFWTLNNVVNWIESGLEKGDETIPNNGVSVRASESFRKELKYPKNWLRRLQNFARRDMMRSRGSPRRFACQQEKSNVFCVVRGITGSWTQREKVVNSLIFRIDLFSSVFATFAGSSGDGIHTEVNCQIVVSDFFKVIPQYCMIFASSARKLARARTQRKKFPSS